VKICVGRDGYRQKDRDGLRERRLTDAGTGEDISNIESFGKDGLIIADGV
jgi:hypothetical protein